MINIDDLTLAEVKKIAAVAASFSAPEQTALQPFDIGKNYLIRTVTHIDIGTVVAVGDKEIVLTNASWIADTGRFHQCVTEGTLDEVEPYAKGQRVILGRGALIDATEWQFGLPTEQKPSK